MYVVLYKTYETYTRFENFVKKSNKIFLNWYPTFIASKKTGSKGMFLKYMIINLINVQFK
jgi:hypothetical protein